MADETATEGALRVWWIPQIPMRPFVQRVADLTQARLLIKALADYDAFQFENRIKPDYANVGGLEVFEEGEWVTWYDPDTGVDFKEWCEEREGVA